MTSHPNSIAQTLVSCLNDYVQALPKGQNPDHLWETVIQEVERGLIQFALEKTKGNKSKTSTFLGLNRNTLYKKMDQYQLRDDK